MNDKEKPSLPPSTITVRLYCPKIKSGYLSFCEVNKRSADAQTRLLIEQALLNSGFIRPEQLNNHTQ